MSAFLDSPWAGQTFSPPTPLDIAALEVAIVEQLQTYLLSALGPQSIEVSHFPDKPESYELRHRIGVALVIYAGSTYEKIQDVGHVIQERELLWDVGLRVRDLGWAYGGPPSGTSPGAYQIIEAVRLALQDFQPNTGCTPMRCMHDRFLDRDRQGGVWVYEFRFGTRTMAVPNYIPPTFPLFIHGTALEEGGQTSAQVQLALLAFSSNTITLPQPNITAVIIKSSDLATTYVQGADYTVDNEHGIISRNPGGAIPANATVAVSYAFGDVVTALASGGTTPFAPSN